MVISYGQNNLEVWREYIRDTEFEDGPIETKTLGVKILESVFSGTSYIRSLRDLLITSEVIKSPQWESFWRKHSKEECK